MSTGLVLVVDDDELILNMLNMLVSFFGFEVITASDGRQAVDLATSRQPHLILMDISMPVLDGLRAIYMLKENPRTQHIPIIAFSGLYVDSAQRAQLLDEAGCVAFLPKPIDTERLYRAVTSASRTTFERAGAAKVRDRKVQSRDDRSIRRGAVRRLIAFLSR
jgi:two-component system cell cycle response regulator DivK